MDFERFAEGYGLIMGRAIADGYWHRTRTHDHPRKRNGAYVFNGDRGALKNWATMTDCVVWRENGSPLHGHNAKAVIESVHQQRQRWETARNEAVALLAQAERATHPYLVRKGFPELLGLVRDGVLLIPMRDCRRYEVVNSIQRIDAEGNKLFLHGGKAKGSVFRMGSRGPAWLCEGYATGLSIQAALADLRQQAQVWVCFSASNLTYVAQYVPRPAFVFADHDENGVGQKAAIATGLPYCMAQEGDANDCHQARGLRAVAGLILDAQNADA